MQKSTLIFNAKEMLERIKNIDEEIDYIKLVCVDTNGKIFVFNILRRLADLTRSIYYADTSLEYPKDIQNEIKCLFRDLDHYKPENFNKKKILEGSFKNCKQIFYGRNMIIGYI